MENPLNTLRHRLHSCYSFADGPRLEMPAHLAVDDFDVLKIHHILRDKIIYDDDI